jgi:hypothetical protein
MIDRDRLKLERAEVTDADALRELSRNWRTNAANDCVAEIGELAELAAGLLADARSLRDRVAELADDGMEIPTLVAAVDCLYAAADAAARELAAVDNDFDDWMSLSETRGAR